MHVPSSSIANFSSEPRSPRTISVCLKPRIDEPSTRGRFRMPLPGALLDSDDDDVPSYAATPVTPQSAVAVGARAGQTYNEESAPHQYIGQARPSSSVHAPDGSAAAEDASRNVRARSETSAAGAATPSVVSVSTPVALSRTPSSGWGIGLVAVTPKAAPAPAPAPAPTAVPPVITKVESVASPHSSPKAADRPPQRTVEPLSRTGSSEGSDSDAGEGLSKGILADRIESVQREIDLLNAEIQRLQQDIERNPSPPPAPVHEPPSNQSAFSSLAASAAVIEPPHSHSPTPTPSPSPPRHYSIRAQIDSDLVRKIYAENQSQRARAYCDIDAMLGLPNRAVLTSGTHVFDPYSLGMVGDETVLYTHVQDSPFFAANIRRFAQVKHLIVEKVREAYQKRQKLIHKAVRLERRLREAAISAGMYEAPAIEAADSAIRTPRLRREVTAISTDASTPRSGAAPTVERSERRVSRNACAVIPPMLTEQEKKAVAFDNRNTIDPDPMLTLQIRKLSNAWSDEEHAAFFERFAAHDKQFHKIAEFIVNKTCNDVVEFYYKNKNRTAFKHRLKLINRLKERSLPFLRHGSHDAMLSNLRDGAIATYVATRPGCDAFIWLRQRQAEEQEIARAEAELGRLVRELAARKEAKMKASNHQPAPKAEKVKSSGKASKEKDKKNTGPPNEKESKANIGTKDKGKGVAKDAVVIKTEQASGGPKQDSGTITDFIANTHDEDHIDTDAQAVPAASVSFAADGSESLAFDNALSKKVPKSRSIGWSPDEENVFVSFLQAHGKDWKKISSLMPGKSQVALRQQYKKMTEQGQLPESLVKSAAGGGSFLVNPTKSAKAQARRMQQLTVSATASELVEAGTEHFALRDLSQVDSQQLGHLFMMHMMQQLQNSQGSDADRAQLAQIVNTLQEHRSQTFLQLIHEAAQLLVNQQAEAAAAAGGNLEDAGDDDEAVEDDEEGEGGDGCDNDGEMKESSVGEVQHDGSQEYGGDAGAGSAVDCGKTNNADGADADEEMQDGDSSPTGERTLKDEHGNDCDLEEECSEALECGVANGDIHDDSNADAGPALVSGDIEGANAADSADEMQEGDPAPTVEEEEASADANYVPEASDATVLHNIQDDFTASHSNTQQSTIEE